VRDEYIAVYSGGGDGVGDEPPIDFLCIANPAATHASMPARAGASCASRSCFRKNRSAWWSRFRHHRRCQTILLHQHDPLWRRDVDAFASDALKNLARVFEGIVDAAPVPILAPHR
jgi:hypothetical protein